MADMTCDLFLDVVTNFFLIIEMHSDLPYTLFLVNRYSIEMNEWEV